jgi:hypothetical protein
LFDCEARRDFFAAGSLPQISRNRLCWHARCATSGMFKISKSSSRRWVLFCLSGRIDAEAVSELRSLLTRESAGRKLLLDLREVQIVDAEAVEYFACCKDAGMRLRNCPAYIREWIGNRRR